MRSSQRTSDWPGGLGGYKGTYSAPPVTTEARQQTIDGNIVEVELAPATQIRLTLGTRRYVNEPTYDVW